MKTLIYLSGLFDRVLYQNDGEIQGDYSAEEFQNLSAKQWDEMDLLPYADCHPMGLSGGQKQRVAHGAFVPCYAGGYQYRP